MYTVYVLYFEKYDKLYIGYTSDLINRFRSHQTLSAKGYTIRYRPWKMLHTEHFEKKESALLRETQLKGGLGRRWLRENIHFKTGLCHSFFFHIIFK